jgi:hypothetical protein
MLMFDQGVARIPNDPVVIEEHTSFTFETLPSGADRYEAPEGRHDDTVIAHALAAWGMRQVTSSAPPQPRNLIADRTSSFGPIDTDGARRAWLRAKSNRAQDSAR